MPPEEKRRRSESASWGALACWRHFDQSRGWHCLEVGARFGARMRLDAGRGAHAECDRASNPQPDRRRGKGTPMSKRLLVAAAAFVTVAAGPAFAGKGDNTVRFAYDQVIENVD